MNIINFNGIKLVKTRYCFVYAGDDGFLYSVRRLKTTRKTKIIRLRAHFGDTRFYRLLVKLHDGSRRCMAVHRIVCEAFHGQPPEPGSEVDHLDCDRRNNKPTNLEWVSRQENLRRYHKKMRGLGTKKVKWNVKYPRILSKDLAVRLVHAGISQKEISDLFQISPQAVGQKIGGSLKASAEYAVFC